MGEFTEKTKSAANVTVGKIRAAAGRATGNHTLLAMGIAQQRRGRAQRFAGTIKGALGNKI